MRATEARTVVTSSGRRQRRSITSASTPSAASVSAAARASCTPFITETIVRSLPGRTTLAWPSGSSSDPSPASSFSEYSRLCSMKSTGLSSRIELLSSALASCGNAGQTIFRPATPANQVAGICECIAPKRPPAPTAHRTTSGTECCSPETYQYLAAWLTSESIGSAMKSPNMISITGRSPVMAAPNAAPPSASSEIGVSKTRSSPNRSRSPGVALKTPPGGGDVLAEEDHLLVALELLGQGVANRGAELEAHAAYSVARSAAGSG